MTEKTPAVTQPEPTETEQNLSRQLEAKMTECDKLYRLLNYYRAKISDFEIAMIDKDVEIDRLRAAAKPVR